MMRRKVHGLDATVGAAASLIPGGAPGNIYVADYNSVKADAHPLDPIPISSGGTPVASLQLPAGKYMITAKVVIYNTDPSQQHDSTCTLYLGATMLDKGDAYLQGPFQAPSWMQNFALVGSVSLSSQGTITLYCSAAADPGAQTYGYAQYPKLAAIQTSQLTVNGQ